MGDRRRANPAEGNAELTRDVEAAKKLYAPNARWSAESVGYFIQSVLQGSFVFAKIVPNKVIEYVFGDRAGVVEFVPAANGVTVRVTFDAETTNPEEKQRQGCQAILNNFAKHVVAKDKAAK